MNAPTYPDTPLQAVAALIIGRAVMWGMWSTLPAAPAPALLWAYIGLDTIVLLWQLRVAQKTIRASGASGWSYLLALLAIIAIAMVGAAGLNRLSELWMNSAPTIAASAPFRIDGDTAYLDGPIDFDTYEAMQTTLSSDTPPATLELHSKGGRIGAARGIARLVREAGLNTHVTATCASACALVFAAGQVRTKTPEARIGFHGYRLNSNVVTVSAADEATRDRADLEARGISADFLIKAYETPHDDMWFPTTPELRAAGVLTD